MARQSPSPADTPRFIAGVVALFLVSVAAFLAAWTLVPRLVLGWEPVAITSDSMTPSIEHGDIVLAVPDEGVGLPAGSVVVFHDPAGPGLITHRISAVNPDGSYVTKGDASHRPDSTPLDPSRVVGVGRLLVPFAGYPIVWSLAGSRQGIAVIVAGLVILLWMARWPFLHDPWRARTRRRGRGAATTVGLVLVLVAAPLPRSRAAFADPTANVGNTVAGAAAFVQDSFRVSTYEIGDGTFTGLTYTLTLDQDLATDYFVIMRGAAGAGNGGTHRNPDENYARVSGDPHANFPIVTAPNQLRLARETATGAWQGQITVVESVADQAQSGFRLLDVVEIPMGPGAVTGFGTVAGGWSDINQVGLYGGIRGGGVSTTSPVRGDHTTAWARIYPQGADTIALQRQAGTGLSGTTFFTVYAVEWGAEWTIQRATVSGSAGGNGADQAGEYTSAPITPVSRDRSFVLGFGTTAGDGLGDGWEGQVFTLGNGVTQQATESTVAVGGEFARPRIAEIYVHTHPALAVDYRFGTDGGNPGISSGALSGTATVDPALAAETYTDNAGISATTGYRFGIIANSSNGTGTAYPRPMIWSRPTGPGTATWTRSRSGQPGAFWLQIVDFASVKG